MKRTTLAIILSLVFVVPQAQALTLDHRDGMIAGAEHLLEVQHESGAFPWIESSDVESESSQGLAAMGLLEAYKLTGDEGYLEAAAETVAWLKDHVNADPLNNLLSPANYYFIAEYAVLSGELDDIDFARDALETLLDQRGDARAYGELILEIHKAEGHPNLGIWDVALFMRASQDLGFLNHAEAFADAVLETDIVDPWDATADGYEIGLAGLIFGLAEANWADHFGTVHRAHDALIAVQADSGSFPLTVEGTVHEDRLQATAYAVWGLSTIGDLSAAHAACDFLVAVQADDGSWHDAWAIPAFEGEATQALAMCHAPVRNGATSYADLAIGRL